MKAFLIIALMLAGTGSAFAQTAYVSRTGSGTSCTMSAPCGSLFSAWSVAGANGTIFILDSGFWANISGSIVSNIQGSGGGTSIEYIGFLGNARDVVVKDLSIARSWNTYGLSFTVPGGSFTVENVSLSKPTGSNMSGVVFAPTGPASLTLKNVRFNGFSTGSGAAIKIVTGGYNVDVSLENVQVSGGVRGILIDASAGGFAKVSVKDSTFANIAGPGITGWSSSGNVRLYLDNVTSVNNTHGIIAHGAKTIVWLGSSTIAGNSIGVHRANGGSVQSYKDNYIFNNTVNGTPLTDSWYPPAATGEVAAAGK